MVDESIIQLVQRYLRKLPEFGIQPSFGILFGSYVTGRAHQWSDIDLVVIAKQFDTEYPHEDVSKLWRAAGRVDSRIEPIPCGERQWEEDDETPIIEIARREGVKVEPVEESVSALTEEG